MGFLTLFEVASMPILQVLIISICSAGNLGNILLIIIPAICKENGSPFGDANVCSTIGLSYVSYSMAVGAFYIWTYTFHLIRSAGVIYRASLEAEDPKKQANKDLEADEKSLLLTGAEHAPSQLQTIEVKRSARQWSQVMGILHQVGDELMSPPVVAAILGFIFGAVTWLRDVIIGESAPLSVISDSISLLGDGTIPCITLILRM